MNSPLFNTASHPRPGAAASFVTFGLGLMLGFTALVVPLPAQAPHKGHLVIAGGGVKRENGEIYQRILRLNGDGVLGIVPTASGVPEEVGPEYVADFDFYGSTGRSAVIPITKDDAPKAFDEGVVATIRVRSGLFFTGGDQNRIINVFRPEAGDSPAYQACLDILGRGGVIAGSSAGAAMMSDPMLRWGNSAEALTMGVSAEEDRGVGIGRGMGFFPFGLTDQHFLTRGRLGRLIAALEQTDTPFGFGVNDNHAIVVDLESGRIEAIGGPNALLFVDMREATRNGLQRSGIRLSLLGSGDIMNGRTGEVYPGSGKTPLRPLLMGRETLRDEADVWADDVIANMLRALALEPATEVRGHDANLTLIITEDERTRMWGNTSERDFGITVINARLDIVAKGGTASNVRLVAPAQ